MIEHVMHLSKSAVIVNCLKKEDKISVVVPVYNEIKIIKAFHKKLVGSLGDLKIPFEIIYVDDRSGDGTGSWLVNQAKKTEQKGIVSVLKKQGKKGRAFSLAEGFEKATGTIFVMIDADLPYLSSSIVPMISELAYADIVVADRALSKALRIFAKTFFCLDCDIQSGLKVFKSRVFETVRFLPATGWTFDLEFLYRAKYAGFSIKNHPISFFPGKRGNSKIKLLLSVLEIGLNALMLKLRDRLPLVIPASSSDTMRGAGIGYKNRKYITHSTLPYKESALETLSNGQIIVLLILGFFTFLSFFYSPLTEARIIITLLTLFYFADSVFNFILILRSLRKPVEISFTDKALRNISENKLPVYSILCPLYKEAIVVEQFLQAIKKLDYPKQKLDVMLLLEEDDRETVESVKRMRLPDYVRIITVPYSSPRTKPKACNYGLSFARGEFLVIYDAEDIPDPMQLKKAYLGFATLPKNVRCLQAKLNYYNAYQNFLTRFFTAEYSLWFDLTLTGFQSLNSAIPLGGTSNHFRTADLHQLKGWDAFNVTEDADLGVRIFKKGFKTAIIDSTTLEEANSDVNNWLRQRSRWIKGYMQTYFVHMRDFHRFARRNGLLYALIFQLTIGGKLIFLLVNPLMWIVTFSYFAFYEYTSSIIELVFYAPVSYLAVSSMVFGNFLSLYYYMLACAKRNQWSLVKYIFLVPFYWAMMSYAGFIALYQLFVRPHYWEKTIHGFYLFSPTPAEKAARPVIHGFGQFTALSGAKYGAAEKQALSSSPGRFGRLFIFRSSFIRGLLAAFYQFLFLGADVMLVFYLYPESVASSYFRASIIGKSIYLASQFAAFSTYSIFRMFGVKLKEKRKVSYLVFSTFLTSWTGVVIFGFSGTGFAPASPELLSFTIAMMCFAIANVFVLYNLRRDIHAFLAVAYIARALQLAVIFLTRTDLLHIAQMTAYLAGAEALFMFLLHLNKGYFRVIENNLRGLFSLLNHDRARESWEKKRMSILIFNWRDTQHVYAGGAEVYVHELAKRWVTAGNKVTMFCGNDNKHVQNESVDGVEIFRRGGTYTVYFFAFIYYIFKFRGKYDLIIDCENGIPFFTPLYVRKPIILVIHHVHQEVIRKYLSFPMCQIASMLEAKFMPIIYRDKKVVTVSESSKEEIIKLGFTQEENIEIVYNGKSVVMNALTVKTKYPSFLYLGRLQGYKNIDVAIIAFSRVLKKYPEAKFKIVGYGESYAGLRKLAERLKVNESVSFSGKVTHMEKARLLSEAWVVLQPSEIEGWGITVIEANACGTPVIASRVSGLCDSVVHGRTGILVESRNASLFANAMEQLIWDSQFRNKLSREAYLWSTNFSWDKSANIFYNLIGKIIPLQGQGAPVYSDIRLKI